MLNGALQAKAAFAQPHPAPAVLPKVLAEYGIGQNIALEKNEEKLNEQKNGIE